MFIAIPRIKAIQEVHSQVSDPLDYCPHVANVDDSVVVGAFLEEDSFGPISVYVVCRDCMEENNKEDDTDETDGDNIEEEVTNCAMCDVEINEQNSIEMDNALTQGGTSTMCYACLDDYLDQRPDFDSSENTDTGWVDDMDRETNEFTEDNCLDDDDEWVDADAWMTDGEE